MPRVSWSVKKQVSTPCSAEWMEPSTSDLAPRPCLASCDLWSHVISLSRPLKFWVRTLRRNASDLYLVEEDGGREHIRFEENTGASVRSTLYAPGTAAFLRLVDRVVATGICDIEDLDQNPAKESERTHPRVGPHIRWYTQGSGGRRGASLFRREGSCPGTRHCGA